MLPTSMPQPTTLSTSSAISPQQERTEPSGHRPCRRGVKSSLRREPDVPGDLLRALFGNVTEPHRNIEVIWLLRSLKPDFETIADFRRDNRAAFRSVFREFVLLCRGSTSTDASCWPWMERASRRSTTRIANPGDQIEQEGARTPHVRLNPS